MAHGSPPQYALLTQALLHAIEGGQYPVGALLPTEAALGQRYSVSRITVRAALRELQSRGLVSRRAGSGTRVVSVQTRSEFVHVSESLDAILQSAGTTRFQVLKRGQVTADAALARELLCDPGQSFHLAEGLRTREAAPPMCYTRLYFPTVYAPMMDHIDGHQGSIMLLMEQRFGVRLSEMRQTIAAANLGAAHARALEARKGEAALVTRRWHMGENERVYMMGISLYPHLRYSYAMRMRRNNSAVKEK